MDKNVSRRELKEGDRTTISLQDEQALYNILNSAGSILIGKIDVTRGRVLDKLPGLWHMWNTKGQRVTLSIDPIWGTAVASVGKEIDPDLPEPL